MAFGLFMVNDKAHFPDLFEGKKNVFPSDREFIQRAQKNCLLKEIITYFFLYTFNLLIKVSLIVSNDLF